MSMPQEPTRSMRSNDSKTWAPAQMKRTPSQLVSDAPDSGILDAVATAPRNRSDDGILTAHANMGEKPSAETIDDLRRRMETALESQSSQRDHTSSPEAHLQPADTIALRRLATEHGGSSDSVQALSNNSSDSAQTVRGGNGGLPGAVGTPSHPLSRMALRLPRGHSQLSGPRHKPFTLLSPTNTPLPSDSYPQLGEIVHTDQGGTPANWHQMQSPAQTKEPPQDPNNSPPDLYDLILLLNAEPGLDAWWSNVTEILAEAYGAERASLAVPGDMTDLENIPWGQKATFNVLGVESSNSSALESVIPSEHVAATADDHRPVKRAGETVRDVNSRVRLTTNLKRPHLESRHSIAGMLPDSLVKAPTQRPPMPPRATSGLSASMSSKTQRVMEDASPSTHTILEESLVSPNTVGPSSASASNGTKSFVHRVLQALESEADPLIMRTGVTALFGKRQPVVMTRSFAESPICPGQLNDRELSKGSDTTVQQHRNNKAKYPTTADAGSKLAASHRSRILQGYTESEQAEPNPWSNSPHPSPAARADPSESPFFNHSAHVDEAAFNPDRSGHDYSANQPVEAIGTDSAKTVIHIPLIQPLPSRKSLSSSLRFPTAIISLLTPITPYPLSLRHSLTAFQPHLAGSYALAQQFSSLEAQAQGRSTSRHVRGLGLGGTFSDQSSELELVTELSSQLSRGIGDEARHFNHGSVASPSERSSISKGSPLGTPFSDPASTGFTPGYPTPGRSGAEIVDNYFSSKRQRPAGASYNALRPSGGTSAQKSRQPNTEEPAARNKDQRPSVYLPTSSGMYANTSNLSTPSPPSPRQENVPDSHGRGPPRLEPLDVGSQDLGGPRNHPMASKAATFPREMVDRPLPDFLSQLLLNSIPLQLFLAKPRTGELIWTNSKFDAFRTQDQPQDSRTKDPWQNTHNADRHALVKSWKQVLKTGAQMTQHVRVKRFSDDSDYRWFIFRANPLLAQNGQLTYWIGSFLDVHDQHMAQTKAAEERESLRRNARYQALANSIPQILFEAVENVGIVSTNEQWHTFSGQSLEEALNLGFTKHVHRDDLEKCGIVAAIQSLDRTPSTLSNSSQSSQRTVLPENQTPRSDANAPSLSSLVQKGIVTIEQDENGRISYSTEIRLRSRGGEFRWFLIRLVKVESDLLNSGRASWYGTCTDIHDRRALEEELGRVNQRMQLEMESKTKFFANMSHEIRTPLNGILGSIPWLVESELDPDQRRTLDTIQNSSNNLRELVDNILDVTKVEAGKMTLASKWFLVRTVVEEVMDTVGSRAIDKGLQLNYTLDLDVPPMVKCDPLRLRQILINLVGNAIKFTDAGEVYTRCSVQETFEGRGEQPNSVQLAFEVIDTGRGFSELEFHRLFKQFGQTGGSSGHDAGSGLGLFLSKQLAELLDGQLTAKSEVGQGSTFSLYVRAQVPSSDTSMSSADGRPVSQRPSLANTAQSSSAAGRDLRSSTMNKGYIQSPGMSRLVASPETQSPALASSGSSDPSLRSFSGHQTDRSSATSFMVTAHNVKLDPSALKQNSRTSERQALADKATEGPPVAAQSTSSANDRNTHLGSRTMLHPTTYSIVVLCPGFHARAAIKQHIEKVVPHQIAVNVSTMEGIQEFFDLMNAATMPIFTHIVVDLPISHDLVLFMRRMLDLETAVMPILVIVTDHYQKRDIADEHTALIKTGRVVHMVQKPVKPCVFASIFDPEQQRKSSKDCNRSLAQSVTEDFKNVADRVKKTLAGKGHRILLVEDSEVNRLVVLRYLKKIEVASESASDGQECVDMVKAKQPGYYSLILCDIQMPVKNGYDTCRELREWEASNHLIALPVMALTANAMPEERSAAAKAGFTDYLTKPIEFNKLGMKVMTLLDPKNPRASFPDSEDAESNC